MKYKNRLAAPTHLLTKTELKQQRLKLAQGQRAVALYWQGHTYVSLYEPADAVPMRPRREATQEQLSALRAGRTLIGTSTCGGCGNRIDRQLLDRLGRCRDCEWRDELDNLEREKLAVYAWAAAWLQREPLFLDTETTGLDAAAEIIEIAVMDTAGAVLLDTLVKPMQPISPEASAVNGITEQDVQHAPTWREVGPQVARIVADRLVIAHNAEFDNRLLRQTCDRYGLDMPAFMIDCTMALLTDLNNGRWPSLKTAARLAGETFPTGPRHRARVDAEVCRRIVLSLANGANN
jgi:DNA polymerase-3 subunit epsilon